MPPSRTKCTQQRRLANRGKVITVLIFSRESNGENVRVVSTPLPMTFQGVWKEEKVVHLVGDNFVDKMPNSGAFPEEVGPVVDRLVRGLIVFEELKVVDARAILSFRRPVLVEIQLDVDI